MDRIWMSKKKKKIATHSFLYHQLCHNPWSSPSFHTLPVSSTHQPHPQLSHTSTTSISPLVLGDQNNVCIHMYTHSDAGFHMSSGLQLFSSFLTFSCLYVTLLSYFGLLDKTVTYFLTLFYSSLCCVELLSLSSYSNSYLPPFFNY